MACEFKLSSDIQISDKLLTKEAEKRETDTDVKVFIFKIFQNQYCYSDL